MWARMRIAELEGEYDVNRAEIRRLGKAFGLVTRETSLIVLDRVEDYARYEIVAAGGAARRIREPAACRRGSARPPTGSRISSAS